jgi:predicted chitinase
VRKELENLAGPELAQLLSELRLDFVKRQVSQAIMRRLDEGRWESALIMGELTRFYWKKTRGKNWSDADELQTVERIVQGGLF